MRALTLHRPWAWAVVFGGKRIENRPWKPPQKFIGERIVIHAGRVFDDEAAAMICELLGLDELPAPANDEGLIGSARIAGFVTSPAQMPLTPDQARWFSGPYGWQLEDVKPFRAPIPCRGFQRLWTVPAELQAAIERAA